MRQSASPGRNVVHCTRARVRTCLPNLSLRTSAHTGVAIRNPAGKLGKLALLRANSSCFSYLPKVFLFVLWYCKEYGLPRRFAPRNDMQKFAACPHNSRALPVYCRKTALHPQKRLFLLHSSAPNALATADTCPSSACHCEPVRTLVRQSVFPAGKPGKLAILMANS